MSSSPNEDFTLSVNNFGPIAEADNVRIKPMTVFVGPSNTGKSYLAILLYAISRGFDDVRDRFESERKKSYNRHLSILRAALRDMPNTAILGSRIPNYRGEELIAYDWQQSSNEVKRIVDLMRSDWLATASKSVNTSITSFFDVRQITELYTKHAPQHYRNRFNLSGDGFFSPWNIEYKNDELKTYSSLNLLMLSESIAMHLVTASNERDDALTRFSMSQLLSAISKQFYIDFLGLGSMTYFPAARSGIIATHRTLNRTLLSSFARYGLNSEVAVPQNRIVNDFLENLLHVNDRDQEQDERAVKIADLIERSLTNGSITAKDTQYGPPEFVYSQNDFNIPLSRSSSMVTELAPIVLFLKHFIRVGHLLIIEEPEAHLHPAAQQKFAAALALLVRNGFRILITTHSHYMVEQISDFVAASNLSPEKRRELLRLGPVLEDQDIYLNEEEVGVYGFDNSSGNTIVKNIPFDENFAYAPADHIQALTEQFNRNVGIMRAQRNGHSVNGHDAE